MSNYTKEVEDLYINFFMSCPDLYIRCKNIIRDEHFSDRTNQRTIKFLTEHVDNFSSLPTIEQIKAVVGKDVSIIGDVKDNHINWFLTNYEQFARHKEMEKVILGSPELLAQGRYGEVEARVKEAVSMGLVKDLGTGYFNNPLERLQKIKNGRGAISTGMKSVDEKLYGGVNRGELNIVAGQSGAGKSLFLQNFAVNWAKQGLNVVYITLELSEELCAMRLDAMVTGVDSRSILKNAEDVAMKVASFQKQFKGTLQLKRLKNGCTANDIRAYIKEYEIQTNLKVDAVLVDYLDLCMPMSARVSPSDLFVKDKYVSEELRGLAADLDILLFTASQLNRGSHETVEFDHSHISGGLSKINTADNVFGIFTTHAMKEQGRYQIQFMKTRSSSGVGSKVDLEFNSSTLRISDLADGAPSATDLHASALLNNLKRNNNLPKNTVAPEPKTSLSDKTSALRKYLNDTN